MQMLVQVSYYLIDVRITHTLQISLQLSRHIRHCCIEYVSGQRYVLFLCIRQVVMVSEWN
jgi:hypothetical protein